MIIYHKNKSSQASRTPLKSMVISSLPAESKFLIHLWQQTWKISSHVQIKKDVIVTTMIETYWWCLHNG